MRPGTAAGDALSSNKRAKSLAGTASPLLVASIAAIDRSKALTDTHSMCSTVPNILMPSISKGAFDVVAVLLQTSILDKSRPAGKARVFRVSESRALWGLTVMTCRCAATMGCS